MGQLQEREDPPRYGATDCHPSGVEKSPTYQPVSAHLHVDYQAVVTFDMVAMSQLIPCGRGLAA